MPIRTFLFDLGNVLVHFSHERMCQQIGEVAGLTSESVMNLLFGMGVQYDFERGKIPEAEFHRRFEETLGRPIDQKALLRAASDIFWLNPDMPPILNQLRASGHRLVLLSNTCWPHIDFVRERFDVLDYFDAEVLSCAVGAIKPEPEIFRAAIEQIQCEPGECFYTDDVVPYVEAGAAHGLVAHAFDGAAGLQKRLASLGVEGMT